MEHSEADLRAFVGPRFDYYQERWERFERSGRRHLPFNFAAFFGGFVWVLYRRMYRIVGIAIAIVIAEAIISGWVAATWMGLQSTSRTHDSLIALVISATTGTFGNLWYYRHAERRLNALRASGASEADIRRAGGVRWWPIFILFGSLGVLGLLVMAAGTTSP